MDKYRLDPIDSVTMIRDAGGLPVLAHPFTLRLDNAALERLVAELKEAGLVGLEVHYPNHEPAVIREYLSLAARYDLAVTGGSDFHGANKEDIELGRGRGDLAVPYDLLIALRTKGNKPR